MDTLFDLKRYEKPEPVTRIIPIDLTPFECDCPICGEVVVVPWFQSYSLPMYEGEVANPDIQRDWAGFFVHRECYEANEYKMNLDAFGIPRDQFLFHEQI